MAQRTTRKEAALYLVILLHCLRVLLNIHKVAKDSHKHVGARG